MPRHVAGVALTAEEEQVDPNADYVASLSESEQMAFYEALHGPMPDEDEMSEGGEFEGRAKEVKEAARAAIGSAILIGCIFVAARIGLVDLIAEDRGRHDSTPLLFELVPSVFVRW